MRFMKKKKKKYEKKRGKLAHIMFVVQPACQQNCGCKLECKEVTKPTVAFSPGFKENIGLFGAIIHLHSLTAKECKQFMPR